MCREKKGGLGFKDMKLFNSALLGKQVGRLMMHSSSLIAQILKARYYRNSSFTERQTSGHSRVILGGEFGKLDEF